MTNIKHTPLLIIFKQLNYYTQKYRQPISPKITSSILRLLIHYEVAPGGPYYNEQAKINRQLNYQIYLFLQNLQVELPNLNNFLKIKILSRPNIKPNNFSHNQQLIITQNLKKLWIKTAKKYQVNLDHHCQKLLSSSAAYKITTLPLIFQKALGVHSPQITTIQITSGLLWLAGTLYDQILDQEKSATLLPLANLYSRLAYKNLYQLASNQHTIKIIDQVFTNFENANFLEQTTKFSTTITKKHFRKSIRINYSTIAYKCLPYSLPSIIIFAEHCQQKRQINIMIKFFKYYLSASQLLDDLNDWETDLNQHQLNSVSLEIIKDYWKKFPHQKTINPQTELLVLKKIFVERTNATINQQILKYLKKAGQLLLVPTLLEKPNYLEKILLPLKQRVRNNLRHHHELQQLIANFKHPPLYPLPPLHLADNNSHHVNHLGV